MVYTSAVRFGVKMCLWFEIWICWQASPKM